ncbi:MAG: SDR family oxidoreductase [Chloroflexi bacterium]|nr:SDR family oxidoreductase [Chloroflexota bacterium]
MSVPISETLFSLAGKTALLTGSAGFLGQHMARALLRYGADVILLGRSGRIFEQREQLATEFGSDAVRAHQVDMYDLEQYEALLRQIERDEKPIDVLVNNAFDFSERTGFNSPVGRFDVSTYDQWLSCFISGVWWAALSTQIIGGQMKLRRTGSIVNISTMYAVVAPDPALYEDTTYFNPPGYPAAKAGLLSLTRYTASFFGPSQVRANAILPGPFSNIGGDTYNSVKQDDPFIERLKAKTALKRTGRAWELEGALIFLASEASSFVTGQSIVVDGGWTIT